MPIYEAHSYGNTWARIWTPEIDESALKQVKQLVQLPFIHKHVAVMPDVHAGIGSTVGTVIPTIKAIVPAAVGVDIGCGMVAQKLSIRADQLPDSLSNVRSAIEEAVPHGRTNNGGPGDKGAWTAETAPETAQLAWARLVDDPRYVRLSERHAKWYARGSRNTWQHLGTLGTGNHFIELCLDKEDNVWIMLHSGSRGIGNAIGNHFITEAREACERWHVILPHADLAFLPEGEELFEDYWQAVSWAQDYAATNRSIMLRRAIYRISNVLGFPIESDETAINCHHNYVAIENHYGQKVYVTRKGAVRARVGDLGIIPGSMGARSFIVRGKGNPESFCSCSHGAGRRMSRAEAKRTFKIEDLIAQTAGVECRKDVDVIDEIPAAYKDIDKVMQYQEDLVEVVAELRQIVCVKG